MNIVQLPSGNVINVSFVEFIEPNARQGGIVVTFNSGKQLFIPEGPDEEALLGHLSEGYTRFFPEVDQAE